MKLNPILIVAATVILSSSGALAANGPELDRGKALYDRWCTPCHGSGHGHPGTSALLEKYQGTIPPVLDERQDLPPELIHYSIRHGVSVMPMFRKTEITVGDENDLILFLTRKKE